jgi:hypothetical protein
MPRSRFVERARSDLSGRWVDADSDAPIKRQAAREALQTLASKVTRAMKRRRGRRSKRGRPREPRTVQDTGESPAWTCPHRFASRRNRSSVDGVIGAGPGRSDAGPRSRAGPHQSLLVRLVPHRRSPTRTDRSEAWHEASHKGSQAQAAIAAHHRSHEATVFACPPQWALSSRRPQSIHRATTWG